MLERHFEILFVFIFISCSLLYLNCNRSVIWLFWIIGVFIKHFCLCVSIQIPIMGCSQSKSILFSDISREEAKQIPQIFRNVPKSNLTPGLRYWFDTCIINEGTIPLRVGVCCFLFLWISLLEWWFEGWICLHIKVWILSFRCW